jgi:group I intron endonuclease
VNLNLRFKSYYSIRYLEREIIKNKSLVYNALLKYGYSKFTLEILEYCEPENVISREQYYLDLLKPEYNILKIAGSNLGFKHAEETIAKFRNRTHSKETRAKIAVAKLGKDRTQEIRAKIAATMSGKAKPEGAGRSSQIISILDILTNIKTEYCSISEAAKALNIDKSIISRYFKNNRKSLYKKRYIFEKI